MQGKYYLERLYGKRYFLQTDQDIITAIANGDRKAFKLLYEQHGERVYHTVLGFVRSKMDAEDVTQEVFTRIYRSASKFQHKSSLHTWIYRIAVNTALNHLKKNKKGIVRSLDESDYSVPEFVHPGILLERKEHARYLFRAIDSLPEKQKTAFVLAYVEELPRQEIAEIMQLGIKAVESLLMRAKKNLREKLKKMYPGRRK